MRSSHGASGLKLRLARAGALQGLYYAVSKGLQPMVNYLLQRGADALQKDAGMIRVRLGIISPAGAHPHAAHSLYN